MIIGFQYKGFEPNDQITAEADEMLEHIQDLAPIGSTVVALLDYDGKNYACSVDVFVRNGSVFASASNDDAIQSIRRAEETIIEKMRKIKETRFFTRKPEVLTNKKQPTFEPVEQTY